ncbi:MAG: glucose-6-phosphate dehydrogenase assembly protein OpcA [Blastocatellia bacterium]
MTDEINGSARSGVSTIDVASIERELNALWKDAGKADGESGVTRACVMNLVVYTEPGASGLEDTLTEITAAHPGRAIVLAADREATDSGMQSHVRSHCALPTATTKQVCCEQVTINVRGKSLNEAHSAVAPLLLADMPVYLWRRGTPHLTDRAFMRLTEMANRVIIDSAAFDDPHGDLIGLALLMRDRPRQTAISDLNWARLTAWRQLIAGFFDIAEYRPALESFNRVSIRYAPRQNFPEAIPPRVMLITGWIAGRLGWRLDKVSRPGGGVAARFEFLAHNRRVFVELRATDDKNAGAGYLSRVELKTESFAEESSDALFAVARNTEGTRLETRILLGYETRAGRVLGYERDSESHLIHRELDFLGHDRVYEQALRTAADLLIALAHQGDKHEPEGRGE